MGALIRHTKSRLDSGEARLAKICCLSLSVYLSKSKLARQEPIITLEDVMQPGRGIFLHKERIHVI
jgi:hypothetical protein